MTAVLKLKHTRNGEEIPHNDKSPVYALLCAVLEATYKWGPEFSEELSAFGRITVPERFFWQSHIDEKEVVEFLPGDIIEEWHVE